MAWSGLIDDGLSARKARESAKKGSPPKFLYADQTIGDGDAPEVVEPVQAAYGSPDFLAYLGRQPMRVSPRGDATILPMGIHPLNDPGTAGQVAELEKATIKGVAAPGGVGPTEASWKGRGWTMPGRARVNGDGEIPEWDHVNLFSLSREEASALSREQLNRLIQIVVDEVRKATEVEGEAGRNPDGTSKGFKDLLLLPLHQDRDNSVHLQALVNRVPWNFDGKATNNAEKSIGNVFAAYRSNVNELLKREGIPVQLGSADELTRRTGATPEVMEGVHQKMVDAGAEPPPAVTGGPARQPPRQFAEATSADDVTLAAEEKAINERMMADGARLALIQKAREAVARREALEDELATERNARIARDAQLEAAGVSMEAAKAAATLALSIETERAIQAERLASQAREHADTLAGELKAAGELAAGEPRRIEEAVSEAVAPVKAELNDVRDDLTRAQQHAADMEARADALEAELREERRSFPEKVAAAVRQAVDEAKADWDRTILQPLRDERDAFKADVEAVRAELKAAKDAVAAMPGRIEAAVKEAVADAVKATTDRIESTVVQPMRDTLAATEAKVTEWMKAAQDAVARTLGLSERMEAQQAIHADQLAQREAALTAERAASAADRERMEARLAALEARLAGPRQPPAPPADEPDAPAPDAPPKPPRGGGGGGQGGGSAPAAPATPVAPAAAAPEAVKPPEAKSRGATPGRDFDQVPPAEWTVVQRSFAEKTLAANQAKGKAEGMDVETFGAAVHIKWKQAQPKPADDTDDPADRRKPR